MVEFLNLVGGADLELVLESITYKVIYNEFASRPSSRVNGFSFEFYLEMI